MFLFDRQANDLILNSQSPDGTQLTYTIECDSAPVKGNVAVGNYFSGIIKGMLLYMGIVGYESIEVAYRSTKTDFWFEITIARSPADKARLERN